jgi:hypothetical protein
MLASTIDILKAISKQILVSRWVIGKKKLAYLSGGQSSLSTSMVIPPI